MLPASYQIWFAVFLAAVHCSTQAEVIHRNFTSHGVADNETRCSWNCTVIDSDLTEKMKITMTNRRFIRLIVKYKKEVSNRCVNKTSRNSSGNAIEHWQIWLSNNNLSDNGMKTFLSTNLISFLSSSHKERNADDIRVVCTLTPSRTAATTHKNNTGVSAEELKGVLAVFPWLEHEQPCNSEKDVLEPCINITKATEKNTDDLGYLNDVFYQLFGFLAASFVFYAPAIICFFSPTVTNDDGVRKITLEGVGSPVSFRSLVGNFFFSKSNGTFWHKVRTFSLFAVALPLLFFSPAVAFDRYWNGAILVPIFGVGKTEETLPYIACFILVFYYLWSSYSSFTNRYQALALTLYKHYRTLPVVTDQEVVNTSIPGTVVKIPKELFDLACEQLMPIRVSVCTLVLRVALILAFVLLVFSLMAENHVSATPATRALLTFLSGLLPKIIDIFIDGGQKNIEKTAIEEKVHYIIDDYNNRATGQDMEIISM
ncbi:hypothetical protein ACROYT_G027984 [Oculina patagonica]